LANVPDQSRPDHVSLDFFTLLTVRLRVLFVFVVLAHDRRRVLHFNITEHPSAAWLAQQIVDAFPDDSAPSYLLRDRDQVDGQQFRHQVKSVRIAEVLTAPHSRGKTPSQSGSSARSGASVWITYLSLVNGTCAR
jgi:putative transposase